MSLHCTPAIDILCLFHAAGKQDLEAAAPAVTGPKTYKAPAFDAPDSENPKKAAPILESEAEFVRYRRQRTVHISTPYYIAVLAVYAGSDKLRFGQQ